MKENQKTKQNKTKKLPCWLPPAHLLNCLQTHTHTHTHTPDEKNKKLVGCRHTFLVAFATTHTHTIDE
jgi:hypothetical protein